MEFNPWLVGLGGFRIARPGPSGAVCRGRIFPGVSHDRFVVGQKPAGKVASFGRCYSPAACWPDDGLRDARRCRGPRTACPFDWEGLFSVPLDRGFARPGSAPAALRVCGCSVGSLSDPS